MIRMGSAKGRASNAGDTGLNTDPGENFSLEFKTKTKLF